MAAFSEEQLMELIVRTVAAALQGANVGVGVGGGGAGRINAEAFDDVKKLDKGRDEYNDWAYDFKMALAAVSPDMHRTLNVVEALLEEVDTARVRDMDSSRAERIGLIQRSAELFQLLVMKTEGEAKMLVKSVTDNDGVRAWQKLFRHYHRKTFVKSMRDHREVLYPRRLKRMDEVVVAVTEGEDKVAKVEKAYEDIPEILKIAALVEMMPTEIKDIVFMTTEDVNQNYDRLKEKIFAWAANKTTAGEPVPMDIGRVGCCEGEGCEEYYDDVDVGAVGENVSCYNCGGWGHLARECATPKKGKGKGEPEKGKGKGKGGGWSWGAPKGR